MSTASITITPNGNTTITIDGDSQEISAAGARAANAVSMRNVKKHAARSGNPVDVELREPHGISRLTVAPDGTITRLPNEPERAAGAPADFPQWTQDEAEGIPELFPSALPPEPQIHPEAPAVLSAEVPEETPREQSAQPLVEDVDPAWMERAQQPATQGVRGTLNSMGLSLGPAASELADRRSAYDQENLEAEQRRAEADAAAQRETEVARDRREQETRREARRREEEKLAREQRRVIQTNFQDARTILVANPKGGSRKTTSTYLVAATLGIIRGGGVIAWDANETMGTLGDRSAQDVHSRTVVDLLEQAADDFDSVEGSRVGTLDRFVRNQGDSHFAVLASDEDATAQDIVDGGGFRRVHEILTRFYRLVLVDTGNNIRADHFLAAAESADQLVIPVAASRDSAKPAQKMMKALVATGHEDLVRNAVVLIHDLKTHAAADEKYLETASAIAHEFQNKVSAVVPIPFDAALEDGKEIDYADLSSPTRRSYQEATAAIATSLRRASLAD